MNKKINAVEIGILNYFIIRAFFIGITFNYLITYSKQDGWIFLLIALILITIYILFISKFMNYNISQDFNNKIKSLFNNWFGKFILIIIYLLVFILIIFNFINLSNFIHSQFLDKTPIIIIAIIFMFSIYYLLSKGIHTITRTSSILFFIGVFLFSLSLLGLFNLTDLSKLLPMFQTKPNLYIGCISSILAYNIFPIFIITTLPINTMEKINIKKVLLISSFIAILTLITVYTVTLGIFGPNLSSLYEYPEFLVLRNISILGMDTKIDSILAIQWLFDMFIFITFSIYFLQSNIKSIINVNENTINLIICILILIITICVSKYDVFFSDILVKYAHFFINLILIPIFFIIYIKVKIRGN